MSDLEKDVAALEERTKGHSRRLENLETGRIEQRDLTPMEHRIESLESDRRWGILTIIGLMIKAAFDYFKGGGQ